MKGLNRPFRIKPGENRLWSVEKLSGYSVAGSCYGLTVAETVGARDAGVVTALTGANAAGLAVTGRATAGDEGSDLIRIDGIYRRDSPGAGIDAHDLPLVTCCPLVGPQYTLTLLEYRRLLRLWSR